MASVTLKTPKNADHVGLVGNVMLCEHCGDREELKLPMRADFAVAIMQTWTKAHRRCPKREGVSAFRFAGSLDRWPESDDTGLSSRAIWEHFRLGFARMREPHHPWDPSDFGRCYRLLALAPEWRTRMPEMAKYGKVWERLAVCWDELTTLYEAEVDTSKLPHRAKGKDGCAHRMYDRMKEIIDGKGQHTLSERAAPNGGTE